MTIAIAFNLGWISSGLVCLFLLRLSRHGHLTSLERVDEAQRGEQ